MNRTTLPSSFRPDQKYPVVAILFFLALLQAGLTGAAPVARWPSLAEQLGKDHVRAGSALEKLIRANQDFQLLRADEATDDRGLPPWLRVFWRKAHPELSYRADDPSGGYPLVLKDIYGWMTHHQDLVAGQLQAEAAPEKSLTVGANQRISGLQSTPRSESDIRINFWNPNKVIAAANDIYDTGMQAQFYSSDGGATWGQTSLPLMSGELFQGDPAVDWTSDGTAWATALGIVNTASDIKIKAYKSTDGGATWAYDATISGSQSTPDKEMLWADHGSASPYKDNLYVVWTCQGRTYFNRRTGPAGSWGSPFGILLSTFSAYQGADVKTNAYGDVFVFWPGTDNGASSLPNRILVNKSTDGGQTFQSAVTVARTYALYQYKIPAQANRMVLLYASAGAYRTSSKNLVYASWSDLTGASGCTSSANAPGTNTASTCKSRIWFARSADGGATWSTPVKVNDQTSLNDQFFPHLAVDETNGAVSLVYYDTVGDPGRLKTDVWYQSSYDDGVTWSAPAKVTTAQTDETAAPADYSGNQYGDYIGMSAYAGLFLPSWTDRRNNAKEEIWTAALQDTPTATKDAQVLSQTVPSSMVAGRSYAVSMTLKNVGTQTWSPIGPQCNAYRLGTANSNNWGLPGRVDLPATVAPGQQVTLSFTVTAPSTPGTYDFQWRMIQECVEWFGDFSPDVAVSVQAAPTRDAQVLSQSVPAAMVVGQSYTVSMTLKNVGSTSWSPVTPQCNSYRLGTANSNNWGLPGRVNLPNAVDPGQQITLSFTVTAPSTPGTYDFQWRMIQECVEWFGDFSPDVAVSVRAAQTKDAQVLSQSVPASMAAGQSYPVSMTLKNVGSTIWSPVTPQCNSYRLGTANSNTWGLPGRVNLPATVDLGQEVTLSFTVTAPSAPGTYHFQWRMLQECVEWFGDASPDVAVAVN